MRGIEVWGFIFVIMLFFSIWWFGGREPYIEMAAGYSSPDLIYVEPKWNGWQKSALIFSKQLPSELKNSYPNAEGWWYVRRQIADIPDNVIEMDEPLEKSIIKLSKYYAWKPLGIMR